MTKPEEELNLDALDFSGLGDIKKLIIQLQQHETGMTIIDEKLDKVNEMMAQLENELEQIMKDEKSKKKKNQKPGSRGGKQDGRGSSRGGRGGFGGSRGGFSGGRGGSRGGSRGGFGGRGDSRGGFRGGRGDSRGGFRGGRGDSRGGSRGGRGGARGGAAAGPRGGNKVVIEPHKFGGVYIARGKEDLLVTKNMAPGESVYGEKRISVEEPSKEEGAPATKVEYRVWNPFRSKLAAGIMGGLDELFIGPGKKVLYLGAASGTSVSHVSDIVGPEGLVYAVEFSARPGRELISMAKKRPNVIPIVEDARHPQKYRMLLGMVDCVFADVAQPDQARIIALNSHMFLKDQGGVVISIKANCIDSTVDAETVFSREVQKLREEKIKPLEQLTLEPYERDHCIVIGKYFRGGIP